MRKREKKQKNTHPCPQAPEHRPVCPSTHSCRMAMSPRLAVQQWQHCACARLCPCVHPCTPPYTPTCTVSHNCNFLSPSVVLRNFKILWSITVTPPYQKHFHQILSQTDFERWKYGLAKMHQNCERESTDLSSSKKVWQWLMAMNCTVAPKFKILNF